MNNEWVFFLVVLPLLLVLLHIVWVITIFLHEISHAFPALLFTNHDVKIFIGHKKNEIDHVKRHLRIKRLLIHFKLKFSYLRSGGFCIYSADDISINQRLIIILCGPILTAVFSLTFCFVAFNNDLHGSIKLISIILAAIALLSLATNLYPRNTPQILKDGEKSYSDGYSVLKLMRIKSMLNTFGKANKLFEAKKYAKAISILTVLKAKHSFPSIYRLLIRAFITEKNLTEALKTNAEFLKNEVGEWDADDYCNSGFIKSRLNLIDESLADYNMSLQLDPGNLYSLNNRGYTYNLMGRYDESIVDLNKAILLNETFAYSYSNRGLAKIKTGCIEDGLKDINKSIELDENNSYSYLNLGIYNFDIGNFKKALQLFEKAKSMDADTHKIDDYINNAKKNLQVSRVILVKN